MLKMESLYDKVIIEIKRRKDERKKDLSKCSLIEYRTNILDVAIQLLNEDAEIRQFINEYLNIIWQKESKGGNVNVSSVVSSNLKSSLCDYNEIVKKRWLPIYEDLVSKKF